MTITQLFKLNVQRREKFDYFRRRILGINLGLEHELGKFSLSSDTIVILRLFAENS